MGGWLALIFIVLVLLAYLFQGIGWLFTHELTWVLVGLSLVAAVIVFFVVAILVQLFTGEQAPAARRDIKKLQSAGTTANQAIATLRKDRAVLERKARELEELRNSVRGSINFHILAQRHHESRLLADRWYAHKRQAVRSKKDLAAGIARFNGHARQVTRQSDSRRSREIETTRSTINQLSRITNVLQDEIDRSGAALDKYNQQTGSLRDHIRDTCGTRGTKWYNDMQARKSARSTGN